MVIAIPTGIKIFNWLATLWGGTIHLQSRDDVLRSRFLFQFLVAGLDRHHAVCGRAVRLAAGELVLCSGSLPLRIWWAHSHFMLFSALYFWYPKMTGKMLSESLGKWHFWLFLIGFPPDLRPHARAGSDGHAARIYTYEADRGWGMLDMLVSCGAIFQNAIANAWCFVYNLVRSYFKGEVAGAGSLGCLDAGVGDRLTAAGL